MLEVLEKFYKLWMIEEYVGSVFFFSKLKIIIKKCYKGKGETFTEKCGGGEKIRFRISLYVIS